MIKVLLHWINNAELLQPKLSSKLTLTPSSGVPSTRTSWQSDNDAGTGEMLVQKSCEEPGGVSIEPVGDTHVLWLCHGTSLVRCSPRQVRPLVEESGAAVPADRSASLRGLEELKARSTTQFRDAFKKSKGLDLDGIWVMKTRLRPITPDQPPPVQPDDAHPKDPFRLLIA